MNRIFTLIFLFSTLTTYAQQPAHQTFEVQQVAEPQGGLPTLNKFITINLRKPFMAQVAGVKGIVVVQGVVEPNGHISEVKVLRSLRPDCDREAVRTFSLFNAWQSAQKDGKAVRQRVTYPVYFYPNEPVQYQNGVATWHYNASMNSVAPTDTGALYRSEIPTDTLGLPTGALRLSRRQKGRWKVETTVALSREPFRSGTLLIHRMPNHSGFGPVYQLSKDGAILTEYVQGPDGTVSLRLDRDERDMVVKRTEQLAGYHVITSWYRNGQIKQILSSEGSTNNVRIVFVSDRSTRNALSPLNRRQNDLPGQLLASWDSIGNQEINEGNGKVIRRFNVNSAIHYRQQVELIEEGLFENGRMQGWWTGRYADGSCSYATHYDKGISQQQRFIAAGYPDTLVYGETDHPPGIAGGLDRIIQFLERELRPPSKEQMEGVRGYVRVRFIVNRYSILSDIRVVQSLHPAADREAIRVVRQMNRQPYPLWSPAYQNGLPVKAAYTLPIYFDFD